MPSIVHFDGKTPLFPNEIQHVLRIVRIHDDLRFTFDKSWSIIPLSYHTYV